MVVPGPPARLLLPPGARSLWPPRLLCLPARTPARVRDAPTGTGRHRAVDFVIWSRERLAGPTPGAGAMTTPQQGTLSSIPSSLPPRAGITPGSATATQSSWTPVDAGGCEPTGVEATQCGSLHSAILELGRHTFQRLGGLVAMHAASPDGYLRGALHDGGARCAVFGAVADDDGKRRASPSRPADTVCHHLA